MCMHELLERVARLGVSVKRADEHAHDARMARDRAIIEAHDAGYSSRQLARASGLARQHVERLIAAQAVARQAETHVDA